MRTFQHDNDYYYEFQSIQELINDIPKDCHYNSASKDFIGWDINNTQDGINSVGRVWEEGVQTLNRMVDELSASDFPEVVSHKRRTSFNPDDGDEIDLDRLRNGQEYWRKSVRQETAGPTDVTIWTDCSAPCSVKSLDILWRGASAIALTKILEERGYTVQLWLTAGGRGVNMSEMAQKNYFALMVKDAGEPMDQTSVLNAVSG